MKREKSLKGRLRTLQTLGEAVGAMKALSAHHFRVCRQTLPAARVYRDELKTALNEIGVSQSIDFTVRRQLSAVRREATTQEVLDIVAGSGRRRAFLTKLPGA